MTRKSLRKILVTACVLLITLVSLEVVVRVWGYAQRHIYDPIYASFARAGEIPYVHKSNLVQARARGLAVINTDSIGLRATIAGARYGPKPPGEYRIAIVGDSVTFGEGVPKTEDTFAQVLEDRLNQRQQAVTVKVFNYGASAYSVKEMAATLQYRIFEIEPTLVLMAIIPSNFNLARTPTIDQTGYLIDQRLADLSPPGSMTRQFLRGIHLMYVLRDLGLQWFFKSADIADMLSRGEIPESYSYVRQFKQTAEQRGLPYIIALLPSMQRSSWGTLPDRLARDHITHIDLSFLGSEFTTEQYMASRFDPHPSASVHHRIGETLADFVRRTL